MTTHRTELLLIRHGVTEWNKHHRFQGQIDIALDAEGRLQARKLGARLAREHRGGRPLAAVYTSDLSRAHETASAVAAELGIGVSVETGLRERFYGEFQGRTIEDLQRDLPDAFARWRAREPEFELPGGGESLLRFHQRVHSMLVALASRHQGERIAAVTHGGVLDSVYRIASGLDLCAPRRHELLNASVNRIAWDGARFTLVGWADVRHLLDDEAEPGNPLDDVEARAAGSL